MLFNSLTFILFFTVIVLIHYSNLSWKLKKSNLLLGSYLFYAAWNPPFVLLLYFSTLVDWKIAKKMESSDTQKSRKHWLWLSLLVNLGLLSTFKYSGFLIDNFNALTRLVGFEIHLLDPDFILPMGISFYTFQTLSYTLDIYFKRLKPHHSFLDYALFVSFFPQLVSGPIVRAKDFLPQLQSQNLISFSTFSMGLSLFIIGIFEKTVLADAFFAPLVNSVFIDNQQADLLSSWLGALFFYGQIFCDFAGYSLCAIGTAMCLGFRLPFNFQSPMTAIGFSDFWRRWHISLSTWLRDYLYIPLGGNRFGSFNTFKNLMITMLLGGFWHGAAWTFILWGALHGFYLVIERALKPMKSLHGLYKYTMVKFLIAALTFLLVMWAFVIFRAENMQQVNLIFSGMFNLNQGNSVIAWNMWTQIVALSFVALVVIQWLFRNRLITDVLNAMPIYIRATLLSLCLILITVSSGNSDAFIYFQF